jgi:hypothetical protein
LRAKELPQTQSAREPSQLVITSGTLKVRCLLMAVSLPLATALSKAILGS